ncbi:endolytic transglycosylase MltG [Aquamicrobium sp. LC103]|uniref:endolytic transglycosylase MltG n=1 Tax=Aquamicrobium sp. LC103 TaxID=1120658 RepID=UPI00063E7A18|nr:endolytic transglycosylase MltG [Aquamicrobium sp. LC103]TKT81352.1 endolytic transglycosylase MltG [Aquamicrobium sp. LC103]
MTSNPSEEAVSGTTPEASKPIVPKTASEALRPQAGTPPPRRSRQSRSQFVIFLNFLMSVVVLVAIAAFVAVYLGKQAFDAPGPSTDADTVIIRPNTGVQGIAELLARNDMISNETIFRLGVRAYGNDGQLKAGEYMVKAGASMREIMELLKSGRSVTYSLVVPEGLTVLQALRRIEANEILTGDMPSDVPTEGGLMADTLRIERGMTREEVVRKMVADQERLVEGIWERRSPDLPISDVNEFVTLASIVEKETARADERSRVASVFINRLKRGMRLQSDPTIIYGIFGGEGKPADRPIYRSDIDKPTEYNTYTINGLPPGPIAIPGRASLEAVANPSLTDDLYFVADGTGGHVFATTLDEHNRNVARWRRIVRERAEAAGTTPDAEAETDAE